MPWTMTWAEDGDFLIVQNQHEMWDGPQGGVNDGTNGSGDGGLTIFPVDRATGGCRIAALYGRDGCAAAAKTSKQLVNRDRTKIVHILKIKMQLPILKSTSSYKRSLLAFSHVLHLISPAHSIVTYG